MIGGPEPAKGSSQITSLDLAHNHLGDGLRVGLAARGPHHGTDDDTHRLHIAALELLDNIRIGGERLIHGLVDQAIVGNDLQAALLDDFARRAFTGEHAGNGLLGKLVVQLAVGDQLLDLGNIGPATTCAHRLR